MFNQTRHINDIYYGVRTAGFERRTQLFEDFLTNLKQEMKRTRNKKDFENNKALFVKELKKVDKFTDGQSVKDLVDEIRQTLEEVLDHNSDFEKDVEEINKKFDELEEEEILLNKKLSSGIYFFSKTRII